MHSFPAPFYNKQLIDLRIFEVFLYLDDTIDNNGDNVQEVDQDTEVCRDLFRLWLVFFIFQDASYNLRIVIFNRTAFRQRCCPNLIQSIIPPPGIVRKKGPSGLKFCMRPQLTILTTSQHNFNPTNFWGGGHLLINCTRSFLLLIQKILTQKNFNPKNFRPKNFSPKNFIYPKKF